MKDGNPYMGRAANINAEQALLFNWQYIDFAAIMLLTSNSLI